MITDLEVWLIGTPAEIDAATAALALLGRASQIGTRQRLTGGDAGRARQYLRITTAAIHSRPRPFRTESPPLVLVEAGATGAPTPTTPIIPQPHRCPRPEE